MPNYIFLHGYAELSKRVTCIFSILAFSLFVFFSKTWICWLLYYDSGHYYCNAAFTSRSCVVLPTSNTIQCSNCYVALKSGSANAVWRHCFSGYVWQQNAQISLWAQSLVTQVLGMSWLWQFLSRSVNAANQRRAHPPFVARGNLTIRQQILWPCTALDKCSERAWWSQAWIR